MTVHIESTTDNKEAVLAAIGGLAKDKSESQDEKKEALDTSNEDDSADSEDSDQDDAEETELKPKKKGGFQKRIERFRKQAAEKDQALAKANAELEALRSKPANDKPVEIKSEIADATGKPNPNDFDTNAEYIEAFTDWMTEKKFEQRESKKKADQAAEENQKAYKSKYDAHLERVAEYKKSAPDYEQTLVDFMADRGGEYQFSPAMEDLILDSEDSAAVLHFLVKDPDELDRINSLSPTAAGREFGKIQAQLAKENSSFQKQEKPKQTKAPPPLKALSSGSSTVTKNPEDMSFSEYKRWREENKTR